MAEYYPKTCRGAPSENRFESAVSRRFFVQRMLTRRPSERCAP